MWKCIERLPKSGWSGFAAAVMAGFAFSALASCAMEPRQKPPVQIRLDFPPSPDAIPLSDEERATHKKHPEVEEAVAAWESREFYLEFVGKTVVVPVERAYAGVRKGQVVGVTLYSPNLSETDLHHLMATALRLWNASPEAVQKFETWWRDNRESIVEMNIGEGDRVVSVGVCPSFNREKPYVFKCDVWWRRQPSSTGTHSDEIR